MEELQKLKSDSEVSMSFTSKCVYNHELLELYSDFLYCLATTLDFHKLKCIGFVNDL